MGNIIRKKEDKISMIGLENSGKTSLLYKLKFNEKVTLLPTIVGDCTIGFNVEMVTFQGITFTLWDICGQLKMRKANWPLYLEKSKALVFVLDSCDKDKFHEAKSEIFYLMKSENWRHLPMLILANKQDKPNAATKEEIYKCLDLHNILCNHTWHLQPFVVLKVAKD